MKIYDFNLTIRDPFTQTQNGSIERGLAHYLKEELLEKDNQYDCQQCDKKVNAKKGFKVVKLPSILSIQLN
jgi:ubiquitin C-terminal hydrolase